VSRSPTGVLECLLLGARLRPGCPCMPCLLVDIVVSTVEFPCLPAKQVCICSARVSAMRWLLCGAVGSRSLCTSLP
jgi:hypothetical protein